MGGFERGLKVSRDHHWSLVVTVELWSTGWRVGLQHRSSLETEVVSGQSGLLHWPAPSAPNCVILGLPEPEVCFFSCSEPVNL